MARDTSKKTHTKIILGAVLAAGLIGAAGYAAQADAPGGRGACGFGKGHGGPGRAEMLFEKFDTNHDGKVTKAEIEAVRKEHMAKYDKDQDGTIDLKEFQGLFDEIMHQRMVRMFQHLDRDGDGKVTEAELAQPTDRMFAMMDKAGKGEITRDDLRPHRWHHDRDDDDRGPGMMKR